MSDVIPEPVVVDVPVGDSIEPEPQKSWIPTRKFIGAAVVGLLGIAAHAIASSGWDQTENGELMALAIALASAYFVPNLDTPGGVPTKDDTV